jgi:hypothetical protein
MQELIVAFLGVTNRVTADGIEQLCGERKPAAYQFGELE